MRPSSMVPACPLPAPQLSQRLRLDLCLLKQARDYAQDLEFDLWDFAAKFPFLQISGVAASDLLWLVCKGYIEHALETRSDSGCNRGFRRVGQLTVTAKSCLVLTEVGGNHPRRSCVSDDLAASKPSSYPGARKLWRRDVLVKCFRVPAANQELILTSFEEEGWPSCGDDPLPPEYEIDPKKRLQDTINWLNGNQKQGGNRRAAKRLCARVRLNLAHNQTQQLSVLPRGPA